MCTGSLFCEPFTGGKYAGKYNKQCVTRIVSSSLKRQTRHKRRLTDTGQVSARFVVYDNNCVCLRGRTYIHTCPSYIHTPHKLDSHVSHKRIEASHYNKGILADSSCVGFLGEQSLQKCEISCLGRDFQCVQKNLQRWTLHYQLVQKDLHAKVDTPLPVSLVGWTQLS